MIGWLQGTVIARRGLHSVILDVRGVGYEVHLAMRELPAVSSALEVFTTLIVRPDALLLYGFASASDLAVFDTLLATPGVGPSTALAALRTLGAEEIVRAVEAGDVKKVAEIPGVGAKTASRIVLELRGKLILPDDEDPVPAARLDELEDALLSLGYSTSEVRRALAGVDLPDDDAAALRIALSHLRRS